MILKGIKTVETKDNHKLIVWKNLITNVHKLSIIKFGNMGLSFNQSTLAFIAKLKEPEPICQNV